MTPATLATHSLPASEQFDAWRAWYAAVFDTSPRQPAVEGFRARTTTWTLDGFGFSRVATPPISIARTKTLVRHNPVDHWCISFGRRSATTLKVGNDVLEVASGVPFVFSLAGGIIQRAVGRSPSALLGARRLSGDRAIAGWGAGNGARLVGRPPARGLHAPAGAQPSAFAGRRRAEACPGDPGDGERLPRAVSRSAGGGQQPIDLTLMERVRQAVRRNLRSPSLGPDKLCREAATSRSQLYRLLEGEGGVGRITSSGGGSRRAFRCCAMSRAIFRSARSPRCCASPTGRASAARSGASSA